MNVFEITLDVDKRLNHETVVIRQDDRSGTTVSATLRDHGEPMDSGDYTARFCMLLPDRKTYYSDDAAYGSGVVTAVIDEQYAAQVPGTTNNAYFELYDGEELKYTTASFAVIVKPSALGGKAAESYDSRIEELMAELREAIDACAPPTVTVVDGDGTHTVTIEFPETSGTFTVSDGVSPSVSITDTASGHVITFVDADGEHSYNVPTYVAEEAVRAAAEASRVSAEQARVSAEQQRATAESARDSAESARDADWASVRTGAVNATSAANAAATSASTAASGANAAVTDLRAAAARGDFDGYSPTVEIESTDTTHTVTITDSEGPHAYTVPTYAEEEQARAYAWNELSQEVQDATDAANEAAAAVRPETKQLFGNQLVGTLSGTIDTAADAYAAPPMALTVEGASTQAGTPTPDSPVPILSVDDLGLTLHGKNLLPPNMPTPIIIYGITLVRGDDGVLTLNGTSTATFDATYRFSLPAGTYTLSGTPNGGSWSSFWTYVVIEKSETVYRDFGSGVSFTLPESGTMLYHVRVVPNYTATNLKILPQIELGSTATAYAPYVEPVTVPDLLPDGTSLRSLPDGTHDTLSLSYLRPSTRAGWAWYSREVVQNMVVSTLADFTWNSYGRTCFYTMAIDELRPHTEDALEVMSTDFSPYATSTLGWFGNYAPANSVGLNVGGSERILVRTETEYATVADFISALGDVVVLYALATPITTTLDPIELPTLPAPNCTVWCDGGSAQPTYQMEYVRDTNLVVQALEAAIADLATS